MDNEKWIDGILRYRALLPLLFVMRNYALIVLCSVYGVR